MHMLYSQSAQGFYCEMVHTSIPNDAVKITNGEYAALMIGQSHGKSILADANGRPVLVDPPAPTPQQIEAAFTAVIQERLDSFAREKGYDSILSACTYATSSVPKFAAEGKAAADARDATWATAARVLGEVKAGTRAIPTTEELFAALPVLEWPQ